MKVAFVLFTSCVVWFNDVSGQSSVGPGVTCTADSSCSSYSGTYCGGYSQCKKCVCPSTGYVYVSSDMACLATAKIGEACTSDLQCPDKQGGTTAGGSCTSSLCACDSGYQASSDQASCHLPYPTEDCTTTPGCNTPSLVTCTDSKCACNSGYVVDSTKKTCRVPTLGEDCASTPGCSPTDSTCSSGKCACSTGYIQDGSTSTCRVPTLGEACASTPGCSPTDSTCSNSVCACSSGYVQDSSTKTCRKPYVGEACTTATGCKDTTSMDCTSQKCACKSTHPVENSDKMLCRQKYIGESCTDTAECLSSITDVACNSSVCTCPATSSGPATDNQSCKKQELGGTCANVDQCIQPSAMVCSGDPLECGCPTDYQRVGTTECRLPLYGQACNSSETAVSCYTDADPNLDGTCPGAGQNCACKSGYTQTVAGELCSKLKLHVNCMTADNLCGSGAECLSDSKCTCIPDYIEDTDGINCNKPTYGQACTPGETTCSGDNVAQTCPAGKTCECDTYRQVSGNSCVLSKLGQDCGTSATNCDPSITNVECTNSVCACPFTLKEANGNCVEAKYGEDCSGGTNCESPYVCSTTTNKCDCSTNNVYDSAISGCRNTGAVVAAKEGALCTDMTGVSTPIDWTSTNPVYKQCDASLTGTSALTCRQCDNTGNYTCNTAISDPQNSPSVAVHANGFVVLLAMIISVFYWV